MKNFRSAIISAIAGASLFYTVPIIAKNLHDYGVEEKEDKRASKKEISNQQILPKNELQKSEAKNSERKIEDIIAGTIITDIYNPDEGEEQNKEFEKLFKQFKVGGIILFTEFPAFGVKNQIQSEEQVKNLIQKIKSTANYPIWITADVEGGKVNRLKHLRNFESAEEVGINLIENKWSVGEVYNFCFGIGAYMSQLGFNMDLAPVLDVSGKDVEDNIKENKLFGEKYFIASARRSFGYSPELVSKIGKYCINGMQEAGIASVAKHFPGLGKLLTSQNTHLDCSGIMTDEADKHSFYDAITQPKTKYGQKGVAAIMTAHARWHSDKNLASQSSEAVNELRNFNSELAIMSDEFTISCHGMDYRIGYDAAKIDGVVEAAYKSLKSGHNLILMRNIGHPDEIIGRYIQRVKIGLESKDITEKHIRFLDKINTKLLARYYR